MNDEANLARDFSVETAQLAAALDRLRRVGGRTPGAGVWRVAEGWLKIEWKGGVERLPVQHEAAVAFRVEAPGMSALAKTMPTRERFKVAFTAEDRVRLGTMSVPYEPVAAPTARLLPVDAPTVEVLLLPRRHPAEVIRDAGLEEAVAEAQRQLANGIERAARALAVAGVTPELLATWLEAHLDARARRVPSFTIEAPTR